MINIRVLPIHGIENEEFGDRLVISIVSPYVFHPKIKGSNVHQFHFHDVVEEYFLSTTQRFIQPMGKEIAESIAQIAINNKSCEEWVIHCEAGISRSPAVAIALSRFFTFNKSTDELVKEFPCYNRHVCKLVEGAIIKAIKADETAADIGG